MIEKKEDGWPAANRLPFSSVNFLPIFSINTFFSRTTIF